MYIYLFVLRIELFVHIRELHFPTNTLSSVPQTSQTVLSLDAQLLSPTALRPLPSLLAALYSSHFPSYTTISFLLPTRARRMSFFSRKRQTNTHAPSASAQVTVSQSASQALAQTKDAAEKQAQAQAQQLQQQQAQLQAQQAQLQQQLAKERELNSSYVKRRLAIKRSFSC